MPREKKSFWDIQPVEPPNNGKDGSIGAYAAYHKKKFKLVQQMDGTTFKLYNLKKDPEEANDVSSSHISLVQNMKNKIENLELEFPDPILGDDSCPNVEYGTMSWGDPLWTPWCNSV